MPRDPLHVAITDVLAAASHLNPYIGALHPPAEASFAEGFEHYGRPCSALDCWAAWRAIEKLRIAFEASKPPAPVGGRAHTMD